MTECVICNRPVDSTAYGCTSCGSRHRGWLDAIVEFGPDARAVAAGQTRTGPAARGAGGARFPINLAAGARLDAAQNALTTWVRHIAAERGHAVPTGRDPLVVAAGWLAGHVEWIRHRGEVVEFARDIGAVARLVAGIVNRPAERRYSGPCASVDEDGKVCGTDLYARAGEDVAVCRVCGWSYDVAAQQQWMRGQVQEVLARPIDIAGMLVRLGFPIGYSTIAAYVQHGRVVPRSYDAAGRALFRVGDVIDVRRAAKPATAGKG